MQTTITFTSISRKDRTSIERMVVEYPNLPLSIYTARMFQTVQDITPNHYMYLGLVVGQLSATEKTLENFHNTQNPLSKCRAN